MAAEHKEKINLEEVMDASAHSVDLLKEEPMDKPESDTVNNSGQFQDAATARPKDLPVPVLSPTTSAMSTDWAEMIDVSQPVPDFSEKIPEMAQTYPFELDTFQKQAILKLEEGHHVFVAAHTSAGKTVVAEYAIAMTKRNETRVIYTSPIKALSNQKYQDFRKMFGDVGLLTGDMQINITAPYMVMTTEILRSQLYNGLDTQSLEFVIFDEVHYINNNERGYVWEEVLILLPPHVRLVMLSATVPDPLQFATWLGHIKQEKIYVVSTSKRPVPLCHYLFTGTVRDSKNERFLIVNQYDEFKLEGYNAAVAAKESRKKQPDMFDTFLAETGNAGPRRMTHAEIKVMWLTIITHLKEKDKLPAIIFTFSRIRCDKNARCLVEMYENFSNRRERERILMFCRKLYQDRISESDWSLPQVTTFEKTVVNGIGVHHSGMLPVLKEIVEILFQQGLIKVLFATDTLAMGINIPARTVVFEDLSKNNGQEFCALTPAEYTQMAGRAGRRGMDDTGTVMILCKMDVPELATLQGMMLGIPKKLCSQFRLTYGMILKLLRTGPVSVEGMMYQSFGEFHNNSTAESFNKFQEFEREYSAQCSTPLTPHQAHLLTFLNAAAVYIEAFNEIVPILHTAKITKELVPGKVLVVSAGPYINQLGVLLKNSKFRLTLERKQAPYRVLLLGTKIKETDYNFEVDENWYRMLGLSAKYDPIASIKEEDTLDHIILNIELKNIIAVTKRNMEINHDIIIEVWERRQLPRFKDAPIGASCTSAVQELLCLSRAVLSGTTTLERISLTESLSNTTKERPPGLEKMNKCLLELNDLKKYTDTENFETEFAIVYERKQRKLKLDKHSQSLFGNLALYSEYQRRLMVLRDLNYIDGLDNVTLKGDAACAIGIHELLITELVFRDVFSGMEPAEVVALLSCFVFQPRIKVPLMKTLTNKLQEGINTVIQIHEEVTAVESKYSVGPSPGKSGNIDFGIADEIYEWANQKPLTRIKDYSGEPEGAIVRCVQQLQELLINVNGAAKAAGNLDLQNATSEAFTAISTQIITSATLDNTEMHEEAIYRLTVNLKKACTGKVRGAREKRLKKKAIKQAKEKETTNDEP